MNHQAIYALLAAVAGAFIALQATANGKFRSNLGDPWYPAFFSICGTILTACVLMLIFRPPAPSMAAIQSTPWWNWIGGPLGAMIVLAGAALTPHLGAATFVAFVVGGQLICSVFLDHFALMGLPERSITFGRIIGVFLVIAGVACIKYF